MKLKYFLVILILITTTNLWARSGSEGGGGFGDWASYFQCDGRTDEGRVIVDVMRINSVRHGRLAVFKDPQNEKPIDQINFSNDFTKSKRLSDMVCESQGSIEHDSETVQQLTTSQRLWTCDVPNATLGSHALLIELNYDARTKTVTGIVYEGTEQEKKQIGFLHSCF